MDMYKHVNNRQYFNYMTETRLHYSTESFPVVDLGCTFKRGLVYPEVATVKQQLVAIEGEQFTLFYEISDAEQQLAAAGFMTLINKPNIDVVATFGAMTDDIALPDWEFDDNVHVINTIDMPLRWTDVNDDQQVDAAFFVDTTGESRVNLLQGRDLAEQHHFYVLAGRAKVHKRIPYPCTFRLEQGLINIGKTSFVFAYRYMLNDTCYATATAKMVCVDKTSLRPTAVPNELRDLKQ